MSNKVRKAVFPAAGLGTRFLPATKASPKEMLPIVDKPLIQYAVEEAVASGASPADAAEHAADGTEPSSDTAASAEFRKHLARVLTKRALAEALS